MTLKLRKRSLFPALVTAQSPITLTKTGAAYAFGFDSDAYTAAALPEFAASILGSFPVDVVNVAALKNVTTGTFFAANLRGYYAANDGGGGLFFWNSASTATDNGGTIIAPTAGGTGRWIRSVPNSVYTPRMFGAKADGTNDKTFVQAAIDAINLAGGGTLYYDAVYTVGGTKHANTFSIIDLKSGVHFRGPGGLKLQDNTNVANSVGTATFAGTTMTFTSSSGTIALNQFISVAGNVRLLKVASFGTGTGGSGTYILTDTPTNASGAAIVGPIAVSGINRMVELAGAYTTTSNTITSTDYEIDFDYNGQNNCASQTIWSFNSVVTINTGSDIRFRGAKFRNNSGSNELCLGVLQATPTMSRVILSNCMFDNVGDRINSSSVDTSSIFAIVDGMDVTGCSFTRGASHNGCPWEIYGQNINITGNFVYGYFNTANVCAILNQTTKNINISNNTVEDMQCGITLWMTDATSRLQDLAFTNNTFLCTISVAGGPYMVDGVSQVVAGSEMRNVLIDGNVFQNNDLSDLARTTRGISLYRVLTAQISNNLIYGAPGEGIYVQGTTDPFSLQITGNSLINVGYNSASAPTKSGITIAASGTTGTLNIQNNHINPIAGYTLTTGIKNSVNTTNGLILNNLISSATTPVSNTGTNVVTAVAAGSLSGLGTGVATALSNNLNASGGIAPVTSPTFLVTPAAPTAAVDTNTTQLATTAYVVGQAGAATPLVATTTAAVGTSTRFARADHVHPANSETMFFSSANNSALAANTTSFFTTGGLAGSEGVVAVPMTAAGTISNMRVAVSTASGAGQSYTVTLRKAGADTAVTATLSNVTSGNDLTHSFTVAAGDLVCAKIVSSATAASLTGVNVGFTFQPSG